MLIKRLQFLVDNKIYLLMAFLMAFTLAPLPYAFTALEPVIDAQTVEIHYTKHHQGYVNKLNELVAGTQHEGKSIEEIIKTADGPIFNNAAQIRNHTFYREGLTSPTENNLPVGSIKDAIEKQRGSFDAFKEKFIASAVGNFGSGRTWLIKNTDGTLAIVNTSNAGCPVQMNARALLTVDVREHAYYLHYQNRRVDYVTAIWQCINWDEVNKRYI